jgi:hypothetical protein
MFALPSYPKTRDLELEYERRATATITALITIIISLRLKNLLRPAKNSLYMDYIVTLDKNYWGFGAVTINL